MEIACAKLNLYLYVLWWYFIVAVIVFFLFVQRDLHSKRTCSFALKPIIYNKRIENLLENYIRMDYNLHRKMKRKIRIMLASIQIVWNFTIRRVICQPQPLI